LRSGGQAALAGGFIDPLQVIEEILGQPEFIFEKPSYDKYHKSRLPQQPLPGYPPSIIPADIFLLIINSFAETYGLLFLSFSTCASLPPSYALTAILMQSLEKPIMFKSCRLSLTPI
jgi:hypothetical protein